MVERASFEQRVGTTVGKYRLEQLLAQNQWGPIFLARNTTEPTNCIVRFLQGAATLPQDTRIVYLGRIQQEANLIASLRHPAIVPLLDYGTADGVPYLVYPQTTGHSLRTVSTQQKLALPLIHRYLEQIADGLAYAHEHTVLHRNLSSYSIFVQQNQQLVITDVGFTRLLELSRQAMQPAQTVEYDGSTESGAPEQWQGKSVDASTDLYALGAVVYRMLTGQAPFGGKTRADIAQQHISAPVPSVRAIRPEIPAALDTFMAQAMAKQPTQRFSSPRALFDAFQHIVGTSFSASTPVVGARFIAPAASPSTPVPTPSIRPAATQRSAQQVGARFIAPISRRRLILAAGGTVGVAAVVAIFASHLLPGTTANSSTASNAGNTGSSQPPGTSSQGQATSAPAHSGTVIAHTADVPVDNAKKFPAGKSQPGILVHLPDNSFVAFDSTCTHAGCSVDYVPQQHILHCPCHDATFDPAKNAAVLGGPAPTPLAPIQITINADGTITM